MVDSIEQHIMAGVFVCVEVLRLSQPNGIMSIFIWVLQFFQEYFTYIEPIIHQRWAKTGEPGEETT